MKKVVFVGDEPSKLNINSDIPFVGAKCFPKLVQWIKYIDPDYYLCVNSVKDSDLSLIKDLHNSNFKVIALGQKASIRLVKMRIGHFVLPHPSGLNRLLNDKEKVAKTLSAAKAFAEGLA